MTLGQIFDFLAVKVEGNSAVELSPMFVNWSFMDTGETVRLELSNGALHSKVGPSSASTDVALSSSRDVLEELIATEYSLSQAIEDARIEVQGDIEKMLKFWDTLTNFPLFWSIIEP
jgi:alkyl sulfatase BDS1-like metallo-beta-lactamase superfamily hydrolase